MSIYKINTYSISKLFLICCICIKIGFSCFGYLDCKTNELAFSLEFKKTINNDEWDLASRAYNLSHDRGLVKTIISKDSVSYKLSSNRPLLNIGLHYVYQKIYSTFFDLKESDIIGMNQNADRTNNYYKLYAIIINYLSLGFFLISTLFFVQLLKNIGIENKAIINTTTGFYLIFISTLVYIGLIPLYENISLPISVIFIATLSSILMNKPNIKKRIIVIIPVLITFGVMIRPQMLIPTLLVLIIFFIYIIANTRKKGFKENKIAWFFIFYFSVVFTISQSIVIITNYKHFKTIFYTNRADGYMWGHYDLAKGSWDGTVDIEGSDAYKYTRLIIPNFDTMSELEQNKSQQQIANNWIMNNPAKELKLFVKKIAIFFMPYNFNNLKFSASIFITHLGFLFFCIISFLKFRSISKNQTLMLIFVFTIGVLLVNILFFVEHRVKYFADPYLLIISVFTIDFFTRKKTNSATSL